MKQIRGHVDEKRREKHQPQRARKGCERAEKSGEEPPFLPCAVETRRAEQQKEALAHRRGEEKSAGQYAQDSHRTQRRRLAVIEEHKTVDQAQRAGKGQDRNRNARENIIPGQQLHQPDGDRVSGQKHQLNDPVDISLRDIPVPRNAQIVIGIRAQPEVGKLPRRHISVYIMQNQPDQRDVNGRAGQADRKYRRERDAFLLHERRLGPKPQGKPARYKAQAQRREQQQAYQRAEELRRGASVSVSEPEQEKQRQQRQPYGADPSLDFRVFLFHVLSSHGPCGCRGQMIVTARRDAPCPAR